MKLIAPEQGRVLQLIVMEEIRIPTGLYLPSLYQTIKERYGFVVAPTDIVDAIKNGAKFAHGHIRIDGEEIVVQAIGIFNDGLITEAINTDHADLVMDDLIAWATDTFKLRAAQTVKQRTYTSTMTVQFEKPANQLIKRFEKFSTAFAGFVKDSYGWDVRPDLFQFALQADPQNHPPLRNTKFMIERKLGFPYDQDRFYTGAPLRTHDHIILLEMLEEILAN